MKKSFLLVAMAMTLVVGFFGCASDGGNEDGMAMSKVKRPEVLDHKNLKWGKDVPDWVMMSNTELEALPENEDFYVFVYESPKAQNVQGAEMYTKNMQAAAEIASMISLRVKSKFTGANAGDLENVETYMEQVTKTLAQAEISGLKKVDDYWVQMRYFDEKGKPSEEAYTYKIMYRIPRDTMDGLVQQAIDGTEPESEDGARTKNLVKDAISGGF